MNNRWCGPYIRNYQSGKGISLRQKASSILVLWLSIGVSLWFVAGSFWVSLMLFAIAIGVTTHLLWLKTYRPELEEIEIATAEDAV